MARPGCASRIGFRLKTPDVMPRWDNMTYGRVRGRVQLGQAKYRAVNIREP